MSVKIKVTTKKNNQGGYTSRARVYSADPELISEHVSSGENAGASQSNSLFEAERHYDNQPDDDLFFAVSDAPIEFSDGSVLDDQGFTTVDSDTTSASGAQNTYVTSTVTEGGFVANAVSTTTPGQRTDPDGEQGDYDRRVGFGLPDSDGTEPTSQSIDTPQTRPPRPRFIKGMTSCKHFPNLKYETGDNGEFGKILSEPVPSRFNRDGDCVLNAKTLKMGHDNNTMIVLGQDRTGIGEWQTPDGEGFSASKSTASGYSECMGAGAIDIVVGRMAPFPIDLEGGFLGPLFNTVGRRNSPHPVFLNNNLQDQAGRDYPHPGFMMDAARVYISQMSDIDHNFNISRKITSNSDTRTKKPTSGIVVKADKVRLHSRNDIKLVTGGEFEPYTSMGLDNDVIEGIHLIAGNGIGPPQEPIPKGNALVKAFERLLVLHYEHITAVASFVSTQMMLNKHLATHFHQSPAMGASTTPSIVAWAMGSKSALDHFGNYLAEVPKHISNNTGFRTEFLIYGNNNHYINSKYNTTN